MLKFAVGSALLVTATHCVALSLGGTQGSVIIGRPLDILVQSNIDAEDAASGLCLEAEVLYGEARIPASAITTAIHRVGVDGSGALRVRVTQPVNEPIVTVMLKAGCQQTFRRSYSLLADFEPLPAAAAPVAERSVPVVTQPVTGTRPARADSPAQSVVPAQPVRGAVNAAPATPAAPREETPVRLSAPSPRPTGVSGIKSKVAPVSVKAPEAVKDDSAAPSAPTPNKEAPAAAPAGARLKLDPLDVTSEQTGAVLQAGTAETPPPASASAPADADAASGAGTDAQAPQASAVQQELQTLRQEQERLRLAVETMNAQLAQAQQDRYANPVVYGLGALVVGLLGGLLWMVRRRRRAEAAIDPASAPWWTVSVPGPDSVMPADMPAAPPKTAVQPVVTPMAVSNDVSGVEGIEVEEAGASRFEEVPIARVDVGVLLDLWQQVDFFESIGQRLDAAQALESFVQEHPRASEAPYLRLLKLTSELGVAGMFERAQAVYEHHYQRLIPGNVTSGGAGLGLEDDTTLSTKLANVWPQDEARRLLEQALLSQPGDAASGLVVRTVHAFDDLITLCGLWDVLQTQPEAPEVVAPAPQAAMPFHVSGWATLDQADGEAESAKPVVSETPAKPDMAPLDFDFLDFDKPDGSKGSSKS